MVGKDTLFTDYCGNVIYENGTPVKLLIEVGSVTLISLFYPRPLGKYPCSCG